MDIDIEYSNETGTITIKRDKSTLKTKSHTRHILYTSIKSLQLKDEDENTKRKYPFHLKIHTTDPIVISFSTTHIREVFKSLFLSQIKPTRLEAQQKKSSSRESLTTKKTRIDDQPLNKEKQIIPSISINEVFDLTKLENTRTSLVSLLVCNPVLLRIFYELNCTLSQFFNHLSMSNLYSIRNGKNAIDRLISEKIRGHEVKESSFAFRLNSNSFLCLYGKKDVVEEDKAVVEREVDFLPVYPHAEKERKEKINNFQFENSLSLKCDFEIVVEKERLRKEYNTNILRKLLELCRRAYRMHKDDTEGKNRIIEESKTFKDYLKDENLSSFNPENYFK